MIRQMRAYMHEVFAECGENNYIQLPFHANWGGHHVHFGSNIYANFNLTCVDDGQINLKPNQTAYNAVRDALNGWDPTNGCLYYYNPATATSKWIWSLKVELTIGRHSFARA